MLIMNRCKLRILSLTQDDLIVERSLGSYADFLASIQVLEKYFSSSDQYRIIIDFNH